MREPRGDRGRRSRRCASGCRASARSRCRRCRRAAHRARRRASGQHAGSGRTPLASGRAAPSSSMIVGGDEGAARPAAAGTVPAEADAALALPWRRSSDRALPWPRRRSPARHRSRDRAGRRASSSRAAPSIISIMRSATSSCTQSSRSAEQRWPAERKAEAMTSSVTCSGSAVASTIMALMPPVSAISGTIGPSLAASARLIARADLGRAGEGDARHARIGDERRADLAVARQRAAARSRGTPASCRSATARRRSAASARPAWRPPRCRRRAPRAPGRGRSPAENSTG